MNLYMYRVLEVDDECDPLDHGVVRAASVEEAAKFVEAHLREIGQLSVGGDDDECLLVRFYALKDSGEGGVFSSDSYDDAELGGE